MGSNLMTRPHPHAAAKLVTGIAAVALVTVSITAAIAASATTPGPNGQIAFRRIIDPDAGTSALFIVNPAGTGERQITRPAPGTEDA